MRKKHIAITTAAAGLVGWAVYSATGVYFAVAQLRAPRSPRALVDTTQEPLSPNESPEPRPPALSADRPRPREDVRISLPAESASSSASSREPVRSGAEPAVVQAASTVDVHYAGEYDPVIEELLSDPDPRVRAAVADFFNE